jgi:thioredoxin reductase
MVVIGAGAAGLVTAASCGGLGAKTAIIERHLMGGDCLNYGCVPSKALLRAASAVGDARNAVKEFGLTLANGEAPEFKVDFGAVMERMRRLRAEISKVDSARRFQYELGVDVFIGSAKFVGTDSVEVTSADGTKQVLKFSRATIATGARPAVPPIPGIDGVPYLTNETVFNLTELPKRVVVVGSGAVGCELSQAFARFGSQVTLCSRSDSILSREDAEAVAVIEKSFQKDGVSLLKKVEYVNARKSKKDPAVTILTIMVAENGQKVIKKLKADVLLLSTGRIPNVKSTPDRTSPETFFVRCAYENLPSRQIWDWNLLESNLLRRTVSLWMNIFKQPIHQCMRAVMFARSTSLRTWPTPWRVWLCATHFSWDEPRYLISSSHGAPTHSLRSPTSAHSNVIWRRRGLKHPLSRWISVPTIEPFLMMILKVSSRSG